MNKLFFVLGLLFLGFSVAVVMSPKRLPGSCVPETRVIYSTFPEYLHLKSTPIPEPFNINKRVLSAQYESGCIVQARYVRFIPVDALALSILFFVLGFWTSHTARSKWFNLSPRLRAVVLVVIVSVLAFVLLVTGILGFDFSFQKTIYSWLTFIFTILGY